MRAGSFWVATHGYPDWRKHPPLPQGESYLLRVEDDCWNVKIRTDPQTQVCRTAYRKAGLNKKDETHAPVGRPSHLVTASRVCREAQREQGRGKEGNPGGDSGGQSLDWAGPWRRGKRHNWTGPGRGRARASTLNSSALSELGRTWLFCACLLVSFFVCLFFFLKRYMTDFLQLKFFLIITGFFFGRNSH